MRKEDKENPWTRQEEPHVEVGEQHGHRTEKITHPAFGMVTVGQWQSSRPVRFFGSDLAHRSGVTLVFYEAATDRDLSIDRHHAKKIVLEVQLSYSQWARLVAANGNGGGVPVTIRAMRDGDHLKPIPLIAAPKMSRKEKHGVEMDHALKDRLTEIEEQIKSLGAMIDEGRVSKRELRDIHKELARHAEQLPGTVKFVYDQFAEAVEKVVDDAKIEVESHIDGMAKRIGYDVISDMAPQVTFDEPKIEKIGMEDGTYGGYIGTD